MAKVCLVSCVGAKLRYKSSASELYTSPLFKKASAFASKKFDYWYILSAKHGLVYPDQSLEPYDLTLNRMYSNERKQWAHSVFQKLREVISLEDEITFLTGLRYREYLLPLLKSSGYHTKIPMEGLSIGKQLSWLNAQLSDNDYKMHLDHFYKLLDDLRYGLGGSRILRECTGHLSWPRRGVYFFFEPNEVRRFTPDVPRVVRVGTHSISQGSRSTLWGRLITHRGTCKGSGNHRGSIFRLHVGEALIAHSKGTLSMPSWGCGQNADREIRIVEEPIERQVSEYIGRMSVLWLAIEDDAGSNSDRAYIEKNSIGLLTSLHTLLDPPSNCWLGRHSPQKKIRTSGLWNLDYVGCLYDPNFLDIFEQYVQITIGNIKLPNKSLAPQGWKQSNNSMTKRQLPLFGKKS